MNESLAAIIILIFILLWLNARCGNLFWMYVDKIIGYVDDYYRNAFCPLPCGFPVTQVTKYTKCESSCEPCSSGCKTKEPCKCESGCPKTININCEPPKNRCRPIKSINTCCDNEVIFGNYKYVLDCLPNSIFKFCLDCDCCPISDSKETITHNLGRLIRIYVSGGNIIVEDSNSVEHIAIIDSYTGNLTF